MSRTLTIPDDLYSHLEAEAQRGGFGSIESFLLTKHSYGVLKRRQATHQIEKLRERLAAKYGEMPDSVELIREDRAR